MEDQITRIMDLSDKLGVVGIDVIGSSSDDLDQIEHCLSVLATIARKSSGGEHHADDSVPKP